MGAQGRGWQGRRERSYLEGTGATEDAARRVPAQPRQPGRYVRGASSLGDLDDFGKAPVLRLRERTRLDDADNVAGLRLVLLVVCVEALRAPDDLLVLRVRLHDVDTDDDRLVHRRRDNDAAPLLPPAAPMLGLRLPHDGLALARLLAPRLRTLAAFRARDALALLLRLGRGSDRRLLCRRVGRDVLAVFSDRLRWRSGFRGRLGRRGLGHGWTGLLGRSLGVGLGRRLGRLGLDRRSLRRLLGGLFDLVLLVGH